MVEKESRLEQMKSAKSFLESKKKPSTQENPLAAPLVHTPEKAAAEPLPEVSPPEVLFSEPATLFKRQEANWVKVSSGKILGKKIPEKGVQLLFSMDNTRVILNVLLTPSSKLTHNQQHLVFLAAEADAVSVACLLFKHEQTAAKVKATIEEHLPS